MCDPREQRMKTKLTDRGVKNLKPPTTGRLEVYDTLLPSFGVRVGTTGRRAWFCKYYVYGKEVRETLGTYPALSLDQAREDARKRQRLAAADIDPRSDAMEQRRSNFEAITEEFIERHVRVRQRPTTQLDFIRHVRKRLVPAWGHKPISAITRLDVHRLLDAIVDEGKDITANRVLATTRKLFNWAVDRGYLEMSPAAGITPPSMERSRSRVLTDDELGRIWSVCDTELGYPFGPWLQMMIATGGQRTGDVSNMRWDDIHADQWVIPIPTKSKDAHSVPLSTLAMDVLATIPRFEGPYVFTTTAGEKPISGFSKGKARLDKLSGVTTDWRFHDIRRTVATGFGEHLRLHPYIAEMVQNRKSGTIRGVMAVYNRAGYERDKREALESWADHLRSIMADNVVSLARVQ